MFTRSVLASVCAAGILGQSVAAGQIVGTPVVAQRPNAAFGGNLGSAIASLPLFIFGGGGFGGGLGGGGIFPGTGIGAGNALGNGGYGYLGFGNSVRGNYMNQYLGNGGYGYGYGYGYYPNPYVYPHKAPPGTYENPNPVKPVTDLPPTLVAPDTPKTGDWADLRTSFASASARVSTARRAVEELRARLQAMGQSPRANLETNTATAEAILRSAQDAMTAGDLERSISEIRRASDMAGVVLKEFGR